MEKLYNHVPFLKKTNERFKKETNRNKKIERGRRKNFNTVKKGEDDKENAGKKPGGKNKPLLGDDNVVGRNKNPKKKAFEKEVTLAPDTTIKVNHAKRTKRIIMFRRRQLTARRSTSSIAALTPTASSSSTRWTPATKIKVSVLAKEPLEDKGWYKTAQSVARVLMMVRNVSLSYRNQYSMALPGFKPMIGNIFGQRSGMGAMSPGLDFAFGFIGDSYIDKARENGWLLMNDSLATPATTNRTEDLQLRATLEPVRNFKIDLNASRAMTTARSVQYIRMRATRQRRAERSR